jgi:hypothetical protein
MGTFEEILFLLSCCMYYYQYVHTAAIFKIRPSCSFQIWFILRLSWNHSIVLLVVLLAVVLVGPILATASNIWEKIPKLFPNWTSLDSMPATWNEAQIE